MLMHLSHINELIFSPLHSCWWMEEGPSQKTMCRSPCAADPVQLTLCGWPCAADPALLNLCRWLCAADSAPLTLGRPCPGMLWPCSRVYMVRPALLVPLTCSDPALTLLQCALTLFKRALTLFQCALTLFQCAVILLQSALWPCSRTRQIRISILWNTHTLPPIVFVVATVPWTCVDLRWPSLTSADLCWPPPTSADLLCIYRYRSEYVK